MKLKDYIQGKRHGKEANRLEREAMNDPFLQDAIDGFDTVPGDHYASIQKLEKQLLQKTEQKKRIIPYRRWTIGVAATIILLLGIGSLFLLDKRVPNDIALKVNRTVTLSNKDSIIERNNYPLNNEKNVAQNLEKPTPKTKSRHKSTKKSLEKPELSNAQPVSDSESHFMIPKISVDKLKIETNNSINKDSLPKMAFKNNELNGKLSGVSSGTTIRIRGASSLNQATSNATSITNLNIKDSGSSESIRFAAQKKPEIITGKVVDENGDPVIGASVKIKGQYDGTITDMNGSFVLNTKVSDKDVLETNYIGYEKEELALTDNLNEIKLKPSQLALNEVVVIGYGVHRKSSMTGAISSPKKLFGKTEFIQFVKMESKTGLCDGKGGTIKANFNIDKYGKPTEIKITQSACKEAEDELIRLLNSSPKWTTTDRKIKLKMELK